MTAPPLTCRACSHRFGKRSAVVVMFVDFLLCQPCSASRQAHSEVFPGCAVPNCLPINHSGARCSIGVARRSLLINRP